MGTLNSRFIPQPLSISAKSTTSSTLTTPKYLKSLPFPIVPLFHKIFAFSHQKCTKNKTKTDVQLCLYTGLVFSGLKGHSFVQSLVCWNHSQWCNSNKNTNTEQWQGKRTRREKNKTSYQIKRSKLIQKISKKIKVQLWHLWKERKKLQEPHCPLYFRSAEHRLHFPMLESSVSERVH